MKKSLKLFLIIDIILLVVVITLPRYVSQKADVSRKLGEAWSGGTISVNEYRMLTKLMTEYLEAVKSGSPEEAYRFLSGYYKKYQDFDTYSAKILSYQGVEYWIEDVIPVTKNLYEIDVHLGNEKVQYLLMYMDKTFFVVPEPLIEYREYQNTIYKKNQLAIELQSTFNYVDSYQVNLVITNKSKKDSLEIHSFKLYADGLLPKEGDIVSVSVLPQEEKNLLISFDTHLSFPSTLEISYFVNGKDKTYQIDLNKK